MEYVRIKLDRVVAALESGLTYHVPSSLNNQIQIGSLVSVPLQNTFCRGIVVEEETNKPEFPTKDIHKILDEDGPSLNMEQIKLIDFMAQRYLCSWSSAFQSVLPASVKAKVQQRYEFMAEFAETITEEQRDAVLEEALLWLENSPSPLLHETLMKVFGQKNLRRFLDMGLLQPEEKVHFPTKKEYRNIQVLHREGSPGRGRIQAFWQRILDSTEQISLDELKQWPEYKSSYFKKLLDMQYIGYINSDQLGQQELNLLLTSEQQHAVRTITAAMNQRNTQPILLHGITSSGKTEVYFRAIKHCLNQQRSALMLVPEISLTAQMIDRFRERFGDVVLLWHSGLSHGERAQIWQRLRQGEKLVLLGARSAVFAPFQNLGLIILDEEHETTYQQEEDPKYHTRDIAMFRSRHHRAVLLLGSATPSMTSYALAQQKQYRLVEMGHRIGTSQLPQIQLVDMREELRLGNRTIFSDILKEQIKASLDKGEQVILFHNRRGFHRMSLCRSCGYIMECPHCEVPLILHREQHLSDLRCHYCGHTEKMPPICPQCGSAYFRFFGMGTEKVVEECRKTFPGVPVLRMDRDSTRAKGSHASIVKAFEVPQAAILVGTQMIAKGFDFPRVTCVGILSADAILRSEDALAAERAFSLFMQVSGRAGRGEILGKVFIQTYDPENPVLQAVLEQNYKKFYDREMEYRKRHRLPPFGHLAIVSTADEDAEAAERYLLQIKSLFPESFEVLGPNKAPIYCLQKKYRYRLILNAPNRPALLDALRPLPEANVQRSIVIDPMWL